VRGVKDVKVPLKNHLNVRPDHVGREQPGVRYV
jgi:hypothetical protein